jgi:NDP-sugar pyrophosphorylase family protein
MQIVVPMSGFGERFRKAGYGVPKPLIEVDGKTMVEHVIELFPGADSFTFVCNQEHLLEPQFQMREILQRACPEGRVVGIAPHKLGPVHATLAVLDQLDPEAPTIVNYCDFTCYWDFADFRRFTQETGCAGAIPAYRGFHPHSLRGGVYAFIREHDYWASDIQEKQPFTDDPMQEFASSGTYYFRSARLMQEHMRACVAQKRDVRGEYYVSMVYKSMFEAGLPVAVYELEHFMQWGTPEDLRAYQSYSDIFRHLARGSRPARHAGSVLIPAVGAGSRFASAGYSQPKPLIPVSGRPMIVQAAADLPEAERCVYVLRRDLPQAEELEKVISSTGPSTQIVWLDALTDGQARTCMAALSAVDQAAPLTIGACDNGLLYDADAFETALMRPDADVLVWGVRGHPDAARRPEQFGWIDADAEGRVRGVSVKQPLPGGDVLRDPIIVGAFTFARASDYAACFQRLVERDGRVRGELYVDSLMEDAIALGLRVRLFEIDGYPGWGTPDDHKVFEYWQSCFHKWPSSPYRLDTDRHVPAAAVASLDARFTRFRAPRPSQKAPQ